MAMGMVVNLFSNAAGLAASLIVIATLLGILDRALSGRIRDLLQGWLGIAQTKEAAENNSEKLDSLHEDHMMTMGAQVAIARQTQAVSDIVCEEHDVAEYRRPDDLLIDDLERRAAEAGATWPGEFTRGEGA